MNYTNPSGVKFKIVAVSTVTYSVYVRSMKTMRLRYMRTFHCDSDETFREMMHILKNTNMCRICFNKIVKDDVCLQCKLYEYSLDHPEVYLCELCSTRVYRADSSKVRLSCSHSLCRKCCEHVEKVDSNMVQYDPEKGVIRYYTVTCPKCSYVTKFDFLGGIVYDVLT